MEKFSQLKVFPEAPGNRVDRRKLSRQENELGPEANLPDGIHIVTVSEGTPASLFEAAHSLSIVSKVRTKTNAPDFLPCNHRDSAIAIVDGRIVGGVVAECNRRIYRCQITSYVSGTHEVPIRWGPIVMYIWVHEDHRRRGLGRQLLEAIANHFGRRVSEMGFFLPISNDGRRLLTKMGIKEACGFEGAT